VRWRRPQRRAAAQIKALQLLAALPTLVSLSYALGIVGLMHSVSRQTIAAAAAAAAAADPRHVAVA
jgi:hypothetical protein